MEKIAVMAGTPVDSALGVALVQREGFDALALAVSQNPQEQTRFQLLDAEAKKKTLRSILEPARAQSISRVLVYCNSLSASADFSVLQQETGMDFCTPFDAYRSIAPQFARLGVLAANAQGAAGVERVLVDANPDLRVVSVGNLQWVEAIEAGEAPEEIVVRHGFPAVCDLMRESACQGVVLGCTHFPVLEDALSNRLELPLFQPDDYFRAWLRSGD
ncbi:MAG: aspartate/glutamate racemase family protein [Peptoniphilaceae bacterium]|nr:aspartate/glutamate racemase family protein [Peptoniphilaceae bacterium]MDY6085893.1 aspartate/glutamate racemase family protein [Peptoniphilaceae bacterium]